MLIRYITTMLLHRIYRHAFNTAMLCFMFIIFSPTTILVENTTTPDDISGRDPDLDFVGYHTETEGHFNSRKRTHTDNTTVAVASVVDQVIIDNIEEEDGENINQEIDDDVNHAASDRTQTGHTHQLKKQLSRASNIGNRYNG